MIKKAGSSDTPYPIMESASTRRTLEYMVVRTLSKTSLTTEQTIFLALLKELRQEAGLRQRDLAERIGEPQSFVSKIESGERRLDIVELRYICAALGVTLQEVVQRLDERIADGAV